MVTPQLTDYIRSQTQQGVDKEAIRSQLLSNGWQPVDIETAFNSVYSEQPNIHPAITPSSDSHHKPHGNKTLLVAILSIVGLLLIGGSVFAYPYIFAPSPEKVVANMFERMAEVKSFGYKLGLKSEASGTTAGQGFGYVDSIDVSLGLDGAIDFSDLNNIKNSVTLNLESSVSASSAQFSFNFGVEERNIGNEIYLRLTKVPFAPFLPVDLSSLVNQWIKIDLKDYLDQFEDQLEFGEQLLAERELSPEQKKKIAELRSSFIKVTETLPSEPINGVNTHHYGFEIDKATLSSSLAEISAILGNEMSEYEIEVFNEGIKNVQFTGGELWIGKGDNLLYKMVINLAIDAADGYSPIQNLSFSYETKDYNVPVQIEVPESFKTIEEVIESLSSQSYPQQTLTKARDTQRLSDLASLKTVIGIYAVTVSNPKLCTAGKIYSSLNGTTAVDGTGWIPVDFTSIEGGSPISLLPIDPTNTNSYYYTYACNPVNQTFEINAIIEGLDFGFGGINDRVSTDGGNNPNIYETGTSLNILTGDTSIPNSTQKTTQNTTSFNSSNQLVIQSHDSERLTNLSSLNSALALYQTDVNLNEQFGNSVCATGKIYTSINGTRAVDGTGWLPVNFNQISYGAPFSSLPIDPINNSSSYYSFACSLGASGAHVYEFNGSIKSDKHSRLMANDGGNNPNIYEVGTDLNIIR